MLLALDHFSKDSDVVNLFHLNLLFIYDLVVLLKEILHCPGESVKSKGVFNIDHLSGLIDLGVVALDPRNILRFNIFNYLLFDFSFVNPQKLFNYFLMLVTLRLYLLK